MKPTHVMALVLLMGVMVTGCVHSGPRSGLPKKLYDPDWVTDVRVIFRDNELSEYESLYANTSYAENCPIYGGTIRQKGWNALLRRNMEALPDSVLARGRNVFEERPDLLELNMSVDCDNLITTLFRDRIFLYEIRVLYELDRERVRAMTLNGKRGAMYVGHDFDDEEKESNVLRSVMALITLPLKAAQAPILFVIPAAPNLTEKLIDSLF
ncbi:MAG: hypothetical protein LBQ37_01040 [Elusimicrobiota bacterium]|jgi:hypothetical protein|nr:hypothetical protein [Elusimicrobiota bacterium]